MKTENVLDIFDMPIWEEFRKAARRRRLDPIELIEERMRKQIASWEAEALERAKRREARKAAPKKKKTL